MTIREKRLRTMKKADLVAYTLRLESVGGLMSNACFNLAQSKELEPHRRVTLDELRKEWDATRLPASPAKTEPAP